MDTETTIRAVVKAYDAKDMDKVASFLADSICYKINSSGHTGPYTADCRSKEAFFVAVQAILDDWDICSYKLADLIVSGNRGAAQIAVEMVSLHDPKHSYAGRLALFLTVENGQVSELHEYHDTAAAGTARTGWT